MNQVVIFFVPTEATRQDIKAALRKRFPSVQVEEAASQSRTPDPKLEDADEWPLWTWFIPNPRPEKF
jgi:hypothetical protein